MVTLCSPPNHSSLCASPKCNLSIPTALDRAVVITFSGENQVLMASQPHAELRPLGEVLPGSDCAAHPRLRPDRPNLLERTCPIDRRLVDTHAGIDIV